MTAAETLAPAPETFPLRRGVVALHATGVRHPGHLQREAFTPWADLTHLALLPRSLRIGTRRSVYMIPRRLFRDREAPERCLRALVARISQEPGGLLQLSRMAELDQRAREPLRSPVCLGLVLLCGLAFGLQVAFGESVVLAGAFSAELVREGEWWRLLTANLLHAGPVHLALNALVILLFGALVERAIGSARTLFVIGAAALVGMGAGMLTRYEDAIGASGIAAGLVGAYLWLELRRPERLPATWRIPRRLLVAVLVLEAVISFTTPFIAGATHAAGFAAGFAVAGLITDRALQRRAQVPRWVLAANLALVLAAIGSVGAVARDVVGPGDALLRHGTRLLERPGANPLALNNTAWLLATRQGPTPEQIDIALRLAQRAVHETRREDPTVLDTLAETQFLAGRVDEALATIDEAIALAPGEAYYVEQRRRFTGERERDDRPAPPEEQGPLPGDPSEPDDPDDEESGDGVISV